jgi:hypothetical protein
MLKVQHDLIIVFSLVYGNPKPPVEDVSQLIGLFNCGAYTPVVHHA